MDFIAKIEGHGALKVNWEKNQARLEVLEGERLFEGILVGRTAEEVHWITPRICGICPIAHNLASLAAIEDAYEIKINKTSRLLRELMASSQMIQSHVLHLFFLVLPDYLGLDRGTELAERAPQSFKKALALKELADDIASVVAGRSVHPTTTAVGGFHKVPEKKELEKLRQKIKKTKTAAAWAADFFAKLNYPRLKVDLELVYQKEGEICSNKSQGSSVRDYKAVITEEIRNYSTAKFAKYKKREVMVGALARLSGEISSGSAGGKTLDLETPFPSGNGVSKSVLDFQNPFHNNLAQAIEIKLYHKRAAEITEELLSLDSLEPEIIKPKSFFDLRGIGAVEAPRGGLYHELHFDREGKVVYANIITPTVQNLTSIEKSAQALLEQTKHLTNKERERLIEMLIRAYDPCITCAVH